MQHFPFFFPAAASISPSFLFSTKTAGATAAAAGDRPIQLAGFEAG